MPWQTVNWFLVLKWLAIGFLAFILYTLHVHDKEAAIASLKASYEHSQLEASETARAKEKVLQYDAFKLQRDKDEKIASVNRKLADTLRMLQQRPNRPSSDSSTSNVREACTGAKLYREDGEFLAREAARADRVLVERDYYYERYENARRTLAGQEQDAR